MKKKEKKTNIKWDHFSEENDLTCQMHLNFIYKYVDIKGHANVKKHTHEPNSDKYSKM